MRTWRSIRGGRFHIVWGGERGDKKVRIENRLRPLDDEFNTTTNQKQACTMERANYRTCDQEGTRGGLNQINFGVIEFGGG
jgi:hypothetical protein